MPDCLIAQPVNYFDSVSTNGTPASKIIRHNSSDPKEIFTLPSAENDSQGTGKSQETDKPKEVSGKKNEISESEDPSEDKKENGVDFPSLQLNPLTGALPVSPIEFKSDQVNPLKCSESADSFPSADLKLKAEDPVQAGHHIDLIPLTADFKNNPPEVGMSGKEVQKQSDILTLKGVHSSPSWKPIEELSMKVSGEGKGYDEKGGSGPSTEEKGLSGQNGSSGTFPMMMLNEPRENSSGPSPSNGPIHQTEDALSQSRLSLNDATPQEKQIVQQMTEWLTQAHRNEMQSVRIKLTPETLGTLQIDISVQNQQVKTDIVASSQQVKELLEKHQDLLRNGLSGNGLRVDQFTVRLEEPSAYQAGFSMNFQNRFFQREGQPNNYSWSQPGQFTTLISHARAIDSGRMTLQPSQDGISIYV